MLLRGCGHGVCCREERGDGQTGARVSPSASVCQKPPSSADVGRDPRVMGDGNGESSLTGCRWVTMLIQDKRGTGRFMGPCPTCLGFVFWEFFPPQEPGQEKKKVSN